ncbi:MAG: efflux RND transporter periplasmic adaptor subunit [Aquificaceae bacterium]|nr:efflux RND transporter periplasmic adaptor subunit [Aquificaceae bacterium]
MKKYGILALTIAVLTVSLFAIYQRENKENGRISQEYIELLFMEGDGTKLKLYTRDGSLKVGKNQLFVELESGRRLERLYFYMPPMPGMGEMREDVLLKDLGGKRYEGIANLSMVGYWQLIVQVDGKTLKRDLSVPFHGEGGEEKKNVASINLDPEKLKLIGIVTEEVKRLELVESFNAVGYVSYDLSKVYDVTLRSDAWVLDTFGRFEGEMVKEGTPLMKILSPEAKIAEAELKLVREMGKRELEGVVLERLSYLSAGDVITSPYRGVIVDRKVFAGGFIKAGDTAYRIADISRLWVIAEVPQERAGIIKSGMEVLISPVGSHRTISAKVDYVFPEANRASKTIRVRVSLPDSNTSLKINQLVDVYFEKPLGVVLAVPESAVVDTGRRTVVFVELQPGLYRPKSVKLGRRVEGYYEILEGLKEGDRVVVKGTFLLDSEAQLKGLYGEEARTHGHHH